MSTVIRPPHGLAAALVDSTQLPPPGAEALSPSGLPGAPVPAPAPPTGHPHRVLCGALQLLAFLGYAFLLAAVAARGYEWISAQGHLLDAYLRSVVFGAALFVVLCALPVIAKWVLIGRFTPRRFRVWSLTYFRFWLVKTLIRSSPLVLFAGSPLYPLYLRALGARIGTGVTILSRSAPVCTDLLTVGDGALVRKDALLSCYHAVDGVIETGPVTLGRGAVVSEVTVLDIGSRLGEGSRLGHASSLHTGQAVPDGEHWHGSPAQPADGDFPEVEPARCGTVRRAVHGSLMLLTALLVYLPLAVGCLDVLLSRMLEGSAVLKGGATVLYVDLLVATVVVFFGGVLAALVVLATVPRLLGRCVPPGRTYPLFGFRHTVHRTIVLMTNRKSLTRLFGDSTCIVHYLRWIGYRLSPVQQTGSNFGTQVKHESPYLSRVGTGTMVADGLSLMNAEYSSTSFRLSPTAIGAHNFLGNRIAYPAAWADRRQLPARYQGGGPRQRTAPARCGTARFPLLRDPAIGGAGRHLRRAQGGERSRPPSRGQEPAQRRHHGVAPAHDLAVHLLRRPALRALREPVPGVGHGGPGARQRRRAAVHPAVLRPPRTGRHGRAPAGAAVLLDLRPPVLAS